MNNTAQRFLNNLHRWLYLVKKDKGFNALYLVLSVGSSRFLFPLLKEYFIEPWINANENAVLAWSVVCVLGFAIYCSFYILFLWIRSAFIERNDLREQHSKLKENYDQLLNENTTLQAQAMRLNCRILNSPKREADGTMTMMLLCKHLPRMHSIVSICFLEKGEGGIPHSLALGYVNNIEGQYVRIVLLSNASLDININDGRTYVIYQSPTLNELHENTYQRER